MKWPGCHKILALVLPEDLEDSELDSDEDVQEELTTRECFRGCSGSSSPRSLPSGLVDLFGYLGD